MVFRTLGAVSSSSVLHKDYFNTSLIIILKSRNSSPKKDVENESKSKSQPKPKRRNPTVRLAFYARIPLHDQNGEMGEVLGLMNFQIYFSKYFSRFFKFFRNFFFPKFDFFSKFQTQKKEYMDLIVASNPISCSQPEGQPEILRISLHEGSPEGGDEVFIIG